MVELPGTHGTIHHWDPPPFGVPLEVLEGLVDDLVQKVVEYAVLSQESASAQFSPRSMSAENVIPSVDEVSELMVIFNPRRTHTVYFR